MPGLKQKQKTQKNLLKATTKQIGCICGWRDASIVA